MIDEDIVIHWFLVCFVAQWDFFDSLNIITEKYRATNNNKCPLLCAYTKGWYVSKKEKAWLNANSWKLL